MSDKKKCPFCEAIALQRFIEEHHSKPAGFGMALSAALVSYAVVNGRKCGRTTDYMKDGKGFHNGSFRLFYRMRYRVRLYRFCS